MRFLNSPRFIAAALLAGVATFLLALTAEPPKPDLPQSTIVQAYEPAVDADGGFLTFALSGGGLLFLGSLRNIIDVDAQKSIALPAAGATAVTPGIFSGTGPHNEDIEWRVSLQALPNLVDAKTATVTLEHSSDGVTYSAIPALATLVVTGAGGAGAAAATREFYLPSSFLGYLRASVAVAAAGGDSTAKSVTLTALG